MGDDDRAEYEAQQRAEYEAYQQREYEEHCRQEQTEQQIASLRTTIDRLTRRVAEVEAERDAVHATAVRLTRERDEVKAANVLAEDAVERIYEKAVVLQRERDEARAEVERLAGERSEIAEAMGDLCRPDLAGAVSTLIALTDQLVDARMRIVKERDDAREEVERLRADLYAAERECARWRGCERVEGDFACGHAAHLTTVESAARELLEADERAAEAERCCGIGSPEADAAWADRDAAASHLRTTLDGGDGG